MRKSLDWSGGWGQGGEAQTAIEQIHSTGACEEAGTMVLARQKLEDWVGRRGHGKWDSREEETGEGLRRKDGQDDLPHSAPWHHSWAVNPPREAPLSLGLSEMGQKSPESSPGSHILWLCKAKQVASPASGGRRVKPSPALLRAASAEDMVWKHQGHSG